MNYNQNFGRNTQYISKINSTILGIRQTNTSYGSVTTDMSKYPILTRSKIQNLPNHKKNPLGDNLPFVVVFQGIQIQRLTNDIDSLRIKLRDYEDKMFNAGNYEVQIKQLTEKLFEMQRQKSYYIDQNEKLKMISEKLFQQLEEWKKKYSEIDFTLKDKFENEKKKSAELIHQIERWHARYSALEKAKMKQLEDLRYMMESQRKSMLDRQIKEMTMKFNSQRGYLQGQIRKLRQSLQFKNREIDQLNQKIQRIEMNLFQYRQMQGKLTQYQNKISMLSQELMRLNDVLKGKHQQSQGLKQKCISLEIQIRQQIQWQSDNKNLRQSLQFRLKEIENWKSRYIKLQDEYNLMKSNLSQIDQLNNRILQLSKENDRINLLLRSRIQEIENYKIKLEKANQQTQKYKALEYQLDQYQQKIKICNSELDRLNQLSLQRLGQIETWKNRYSDIELTLTSFKNMENQYYDLQNQIQNYVKSMEQLKSHNSRVQSQLSRYKHIEIKLDQSQRRNSTLNLENERLNGIIRSKIDQIEDFKIKYYHLESTFNEYKLIEKKITQYENTVVMLTQQIQRLNKINRQKGGEIDHLMNKLRKLQDQVTFYKSYQSKISNYQNQIHNLYNTIQQNKKDFSNLQNQYYKAKSFQKKLQQYENKISLLSQQIQRLSRTLNGKHGEIQQLRSNLMKYENEVFRYKEIEKNYYELQKKINFLTNEIDKINNFVKEKDFQINNEKKITVNLAQNVIVLSSELERAYQTINNNNVYYCNFNDKILELEKIKKNLQIKLSENQSKITYMNNEIQRLKNTISNYENKVYQLNKELDDTRKYKDQILILGRQIDRLESQNKNYQEDIKKLRLRYSDAQSLIKKNQSNSLLLVYMMTFVMMMVQIQALRTRVSAKEKQVEEVRKSILIPARSVKY